SAGGLGFLQDLPEFRCGDLGNGTTSQVGNQAFIEPASALLLGAWAPLLALNLVFDPFADEAFKGVAADCFDNCLLGLPMFGRVHPSGKQLACLMTFLTGFLE